MPGLLKEVQQSIADYQAELFSLSVKLLTISPSVCNMDDVMGSIQASARVQEQKQGSLEGLSQRSGEFVGGAAETGVKVADLVRHRRDDFYTAHPYLKPERDKSWLEWAGISWPQRGSGAKRIGRRSH